jgi:hypothetical protein
MGLEIPTGKTPGIVVRATPAARPALVGAMILGLFLVQLLFFVLIFWAIIGGANDAGAKDPAIDGAPLGTLLKNEQTIISFWISMTFFCLFAMILLYQRFFKDHVTITKKRFRKWEDEGVQLHG